MSIWLTTVREYFQFERALPAALVLAALWLGESFFPQFVGRKSRLRHAARNLSLAVINGAVLLLTLGLATTMLGAWTAQNQFGLLPWSGLAGPWRLALGFLALDAWAYLWHRANHWSPWLWRFHRLHHSDREMDCTTSSRFHCGELAIAAATRLPVIACFGLEPLTLLVHETALVAVSQFHHANLRPGLWDRALRWLIVTPALHRIHHSRERAHTNSNYASVLSLWDRAFGSWVDPEQVGQVQLGLDEFGDDRWHSVPRMLMIPLADDVLVASDAAGHNSDRQSSPLPPESSHE